MYSEDASITNNVLKLNTVILAKPSLYSYYGVALLKWYSNLDITKVVYSDNLPIDEITNAENFKDCYVVILLGYGVANSQKAIISEHLGELSGLPFTGVYHFNNYGSDLSDIGITSYVDEEGNPLSNMLKVFAESKLVNLDTNYLYVIEDIVNAITEYQQWTFKENNNQLTEKLKWIADVWKDSIANFDKPENLTQFLMVGNMAIDRGKRDQRDYLRKKVREVREYHQGDRQVFVLYAEEYINEIANLLISNTKYPECIFFIIKHTKGQDIVHVRTKKPLSALHVAQIFKDDARGNDNASTFFVHDTPKMIGEILSNVYFSKQF